jgi:hypothetical protein
MQLAKEIRNEIKEAKKLRLPWWGILCVIVVALPIYSLFDYLGRPNMALPALNCVGVLGFVIAIKWKLRGHIWFWITMSVIVALHVPLILFVPWTTRWIPALAIAAIDSVDLILLLVVLAAVEKFVNRPIIPQS